MTKTLDAQATVKEVIGLLGEIRRDANGSTTSTDTKVSTSRPGSTHLIEADSQEQEFLRQLRNVTEVQCAQRHGNGGRRVLPADKVSATRKALNKAILSEAGVDSRIVAKIYDYQMEPEGIRKLRTRNGFDPHSGWPTLTGLTAKQNEERKAERQACGAVPTAHGGQ
jgi:hypothetical protein